MSWDWKQLECLIAGLEVPDRHVAITVQGTGVSDPFGPGFAGDVGRGLDDEQWFWAPAGYPAATFPMGPSTLTGVDEVVRLVLLYPAGAPLPTGGRASGKIALSGYSQGADVTDIAWRDECINPAGRLHQRYLNGDIIAIVNFGDPRRCPGKANGNIRAGFPMPSKLDGFTTGGIAGPDCLTPEQTPDFLMSCSNDGDLYGSAPVGDTPWTVQTGVGHDETMIFNLIQDFNANNVVALIKEAIAALMEVATNPVNLIGDPLSALLGKGLAVEAHVGALVQAILNGGMFVVRAQGPHQDYEKFVPAMIDFVHEAGRTAFDQLAAAA